MSTHTETAIQMLRAEFGDRLTTADADRREHACDVSHHPGAPPQAVVFPLTNEEVARIAAVCSEHRVPMIPFGTGTAVEGGVVAIRGGVSINLRRMNGVVRISGVDRDATVQSGVTRQQLNRYLEERSTGLYFPVDPGADASLGGMAATCASGSAAVRYGTMRENVLGLTVVLADGRLIRTGGRARKSSSGYDLTRLFVGSEGTLGIITEVTLRLARVPDSVSAAVCSFPDIRSAVDTVVEVMARGVSPARAELLDEVQMSAVNQYSRLSYEVAPTLFLEFHGTQHGVVEQVEVVGEIVHNHGGGRFLWATEPSDRQRLWQARHDAYYASLALRPGGKGYVTDVCVPISELAECIMFAKAELASFQIPAPLFGHAGDGNFHVVFVVDPHSRDELDQVRQFSRRLSARAIACGGTCTGEHGIGLGKLDELELEHGAAVDVMRHVKQALDPQGLMNPGKVLRFSPRSAESTAAE